MYRINVSFHVNVRIENLLICNFENHRRNRASFMRAKNVRHLLRFVKFLVIRQHFINIDRYEVSIAQSHHELLFKPMYVPLKIVIDVIDAFLIFELYVNIFRLTDTICTC